MNFQGPIVIIGFGSQAKAWAYNLRDSGCKVVIATRSDSTKTIANELGFKTIELESNEISKYNFFALLIPDNSHLDFFQKNSSLIKNNSHFILAHGFSLSKDKLNEKYSQFNFSLLAPKAIASDVRFQYETKGKIGAVLWAKNSELKNEIQNFSKALGITSLYEASFEEECFADLFSEQSLLCSLIPYASLKSYNLLVKNGISKEVAFMECYLELKSITQAFVNLGPIEFFKLISPNALIGSVKGKELLLDKNFDLKLEQLFLEIKNKKFYKEVEQDANELRTRIINEWKNEDFTNTFQKLKQELIS